MLEPDLRKRVRKRLSRRRLGAGKPLFRQGEAADALYLIDAGRLRVYVADRAGRERVLRFLGPGEIVGESAFMADTPHVTTATAVEDATVWRLTRADFDALLGKHEPALRYLANLIAERQTQANARLAAETAPEEARALRGYVTAVFSPRGGAGVTTLAVTLGIALAERHPDDTVLLDLDVLFGHTLSTLLLEPRGIVAHVTPGSLENLERSGLDYYLLTHASSLRVMPAATRPEDGQLVTAEHVRAALSTLRRHFGYVVLDLPHDFSEVTLAGLELAERILVVGTPERTTLNDVLECRRIFTQVLGVPPDRISYVLNHPLPYGGLEASELSAATATPWAEVPFGGEAPTQAALRGESLLATRRHNPVARAALNLAERISREALESAALSGRDA
jgi:pilus assembly protein CpaE